MEGDAQQFPTVTGTREAKTTSADEENTNSPLHQGATSSSRGVLREARDHRGESNDDSDSSAVDSDEDEVLLYVYLIFYVRALGGGGRREGRGGVAGGKM